MGYVSTARVAEFRPPSPVVDCSSSVLRLLLLSIACVLPAALPELVLAQECAALAQHSFAVALMAHLQ